MGEIDPTPRDLGEWKSGDSAAMCNPGLRNRDVDGVVSQVGAQRRIRNEAIGGIVLLVCIAAAIFMLFFVF